MPSGASLEKLPAEILREVFHALPSTETLKALILTGPVFHATYLFQTTKIIGSVVANEVSRELLPEAIVVLRAKRIPTLAAMINHAEGPVPRKEEAYELLNQYHTARWSLIDCTLTFQDAIEIAKIHNACQKLAHDFTGKALDRCRQIYKKTFNYEKPSKQELLRVQRSFYSFELISSLFAEEHWHPFNLDKSLQCSEFLSNYAPWEHEQLASIDGYLRQRLPAAFDDILWHDVEWASDCYKKNIFVHPVYGKPDVLYHGLTFLSVLFELSTYEETKEYLTNFFRPGLYVDLESAMYLHYDDLRRRASTGPWDLRGSFWEDDDRGPKESWGSVQLAAWSQECVSYDRDSHRESGHCFWDRERLNRWGVPLTNPNPELGIPFNELPEPEDAMDAFWESCFERLCIWKQGGTGYWKEGDESKIRWASPPSEE